MAQKHDSQRNPIEDLLHPPHVSQRCGAKARSTGQPCKRWAAIGSHCVCSASGIASPGLSTCPNIGTAKLSFCTTPLTPTTLTLQLSYSGQMAA
jgi:hypothetical protein